MVILRKYICILKLVYIYNDLLHVSVNHVVIFRGGKIQRMDVKE